MHTGIRLADAALLGRHFIPVSDIAPRVVGSWFIFFEILGYTAVLTNLGVVVFTSQADFFGIDTPYEKLVVFIVIEVCGVRIC